MKQFFKVDAYIQVIVCILMIILMPIAFFFDTKFVIYVYLGTGLIQLCSYLVRLFLPYPKARLYKLYAWLMMPVWFIILLFALKTTGVGWIIGMIAIIYMVAALFFSPVLAIAYSQDCWRVYKASTYKIQKFLHLVNK
jgi:hypothetical protein